LALVPVPEAQELLKHFLAGRSPNTLQAYRRDLNTFAGFLQVNVPTAVTTLLKANGAQANTLALSWLNAMAEAGLSPATRARRLATLRALTKLGRTLGAIDWAIEIPTPRVEGYKDTRGPPLDAIHKMLATCGDDLEGRRNRVILLFLTALGLRRAELIGLRFKDYDREGKRIRVMGKGSREAWVTLPGPVVETLQHWLGCSGPYGDSDPLVCALTNPGAGRPLSKEGLNHVVRQIGKRAGLKAWPHGLRHAGITLGLDSHDIRHVRKFSRHANVQTVVKYDDNREDLGAQVANSVLDRLLKGEES